MLDLSTPKGRIVAAALRLAGERRWRDVTLADIATAANVRLVDLRREFDIEGRDPRRVRARRRRCGARAHA